MLPIQAALELSLIGEHVMSGNGDNSKKNVAGFENFRLMAGSAMLLTPNLPTNAGPARYAGGTPHVLFIHNASAIHSASARG